MSLTGHQIVGSMIGIQPFVNSNPLVTGRMIVLVREDGVQIHLTSAGVINHILMEWEMIHKNAMQTPIAIGPLWVQAVAGASQAVSHIPMQIVVEAAAAANG